MNVQDERDGDIQEMLQKSMAGDELPTELRRRLQVMAREASKPKRAWWTSKKTVAAFTAAAAVMVLTLTMMPAQATAKTYDSLVSAAQRVNAFQFSIDTLEGGERERITITGADGKFAMRTGEDGLIMQFDHQSFSLYDAKDNAVTRFKLGSLMDAKAIAEQMKSGLDQGFKHMDLKAMLKGYEGKYGKDHIRISPIRTEDGRRVYDATMESPDDPERVKISVDANTDLPYRILAESRNRAGGWNVLSKIEMRYGDDIDLKELSATIPANAKKMEIDIDSLVGDAMKGIRSLGPVIRKFDKSFKGKLEVTPDAPSK